MRLQFTHDEPIGRGVKHLIGAANAGGTLLLFSHVELLMLVQRAMSHGFRVAERIERCWGSDQPIQTYSRSLQ